MDELRTVDTAREVSIETRATDGRTYRTVVWIVVDGDRVCIRSERGAAGKQYQRARSDSRGRIIAGAAAIDAADRPAEDPASMQAASAGLRRKYRKGASLEAMLVPEVLPTTLRLDPAEPSA